MVMLFRLLTVAIQDVRSGEDVQYAQWIFIELRLLRVLEHSVPMLCV
jgi:hypothetical protein